MRDLSEDEKTSLYVDAVCPFCKSAFFYEGPHGGASINWYCANEDCMAGFNLAPTAMRMGQLIREPGLVADDGLRSIFKRKLELRAWLEMLRSSPWG